MAEYSEYYYLSDTIKRRYINGSITLEEYLSSISNLIEQEVSGAVLSIDKKNIKSELYQYERYQQTSAIEERNRAEQEKYEEEQRKRLREEENEREKTLTPEQKLYRQRETYYQIQIPKMINEYKKEASDYRTAHNRVQWIIILGSATTTSITSITIFSNMALISMGLKIGAAFISLLVTTVASLSAYFKYRERSINAQKIADDVEHEYDAIRLGTLLYLNEPREKAIGIFVDKIMRRTKEYKEQQQLLEQPPEARSTKLEKS